MRKQSAAKPKHKTNKNQHEKVQGVSKIPRWNGVKPTQSNTPTLSSLQSNSHPSQVSQVFVIRSRTAHSIFQEHCPFLELHQRPLLVRFLLMSSSGSGAYPRFSPVPSTLFLTVVEPFCGWFLGLDCMFLLFFAWCTASICDDGHSVSYHLCLADWRAIRPGHTQVAASKKNIKLSLLL